MPVTAKRNALSEAGNQMTDFVLVLFLAVPFHTLGLVCFIISSATRHGDPNDIIGANGRSRRCGTLTRWGRMTKLEIAVDANPNQDLIGRYGLRDRKRQHPADRSADVRSEDAAIRALARSLASPRTTLTAHWSPRIPPTLALIPAVESLASERFPRAKKGAPFVRFRLPIRFPLWGPDSLHRNR
jgi:hypothetical protein